MFLPLSFRSAVRLGLAIVVAAAAMPLGSNEADARRGVRAGIAGYRALTYDRKAEGDAKAAASKGDGEQDDAQPAAAAPEAAAEKVASAKPAAETIPGCAPGMICTVCIAGCGSSNIVIVHAERRPIRQE